MDLIYADLISIGSALVAGLSALYARWAVKVSNTKMKYPFMPKDLMFIKV